MDLGEGLEEARENAEWGMGDRGNVCRADRERGDAECGVGPRQVDIFIRVLDTLQSVFIARCVT